VSRRHNSTNTPTIHPREILPHFRRLSRLSKAAYAVTEIYGANLMRLLALAASLAFASTPFASAQNENASDVTKLAFAAGYKALFTCGATYNANQSLAEIGANELDGIYQDYRPLMSQISDANINERRKMVSVRFDRALPPRIAVWRSGLGCSLLPVGTGSDMTDWLPRFAATDIDYGRDITTAIGDNVTLTENTFALDRLGAPVSFAFDGSTYGDGTRTSAVVVVHKGQVVAEQYARGIDANTPQRTWSVAKSLSSTIIGAAIEDGYVGLDTEAILEAFNKGGDPRRDITLRHVLNMASGLESGSQGARSDRVYFGGASARDMITARSLEAMPGSRFKYSDYDTLIAMRALREAMGDDAQFHRYPYTAVLNKIGAVHTTVETDWHGDFLSSSQVWMTARDMARIGQLYLQNGNWAGEQIIPVDWVDFVTKPAPAQPSSTLGYGGSFWLLGGAAGLPQDTYAGVGNRGQLLVIVPSRDLVIVRRGFDVSGSGQFDFAKFASHIVGAFDAAERAKAEAEAAAAAALEAEEDAETADDARRASQRQSVRSKVGRR
jgi:CubicO group peptidase (beta-lactamase class C family)